MSRDGSNIYHRPAGTDGVPNFPIESSKYNAYVADVEQDLNLPRPIVAGGTGATSADGALDNLSAEKFKQVVTNWDSMVWRAGSFYAATTATGTAPVAAHAFAGIAYYANATDMVCEATDLTDSVNPVQYIRVMTSGVWSAWSRIGSGSSAAASVGEYIFDTGITFPPASGQIRLNNATQNSATEIFISHFSATGANTTNLISFAIRSGYDIAIQDKDEVAKFKIFTATADPVLSGGDYRVTVTFKSGGTDIVTAQWVLVGTTIGGRSSIYAAPFDAMAYNGMQINGSMEVSQENGTSNVILAAGAVKYIVDGFVGVNLGATRAGAAALTPITSLPGFPSCIVFNCTTPAALAAGDAQYINQVVEGYRWSRLAFGGASAQPVTIAFWINSAVTGTMAVALRNSAGNRSYVTDVPINAANTWEFKTVTIPGDTTGTWATGNTGGVNISFCFGAGSTYRTAANTWAAGTMFLATSATTNFWAAANSVFITGVVVLPGIEAPSAARSPLIMRPYDQELLTCQRYYRKLTGYVVDTLAAYQSSIISPSMRGAPTITGGGTGFAVQVAQPDILAVAQTTRNFQTLILDARL